MSTILFVGDYYPLASYISKFNELIVEKLNNEGHKVILLSKSWCDAQNVGFWGNVNDLSMAHPFYKKYFLDPIQVKFSKGNILSCYLGLACKILENEFIDSIVFADDISNSLLIELIQNRYNIPCHMLLFDFNINKFMDNYNFSYINKNLKQYIKIYTYLPYIEFITKYLNISNNFLCPKIPLIIQKNILKEHKSKDIFILCTTLTDTKYQKIIKIISEMNISNYKFKIAILNPKVSDINNVHLPLIYIDIPFKAIPKDSIVIFENELFGQENVNYNEIVLILSLGFIPLIFKNKINLISKYYLIQYHELFDSFYGITRFEEIKDVK